MGDLMKEPWAPLLLCAIASNVVWLILWIAMWATGRFKRSIGGGVPILLGVGVFNLPFGFLFIVGLFFGAIALSAFWLYASLTDSFEKERTAIARFLNPRAFPAEGGSEKIDDSEETKA